MTEGPASAVNLGRTAAVALVGMEGHWVEVEAHLAASIPGFTIVGLPDASLGEARDRVRAAVANSGLVLPQRRITVNLAPAGLPKAGAGFDLAIAVAVLAGARLIDGTALSRVVHLGELGLDGRVHPIRGVLPAVAAAAAAGAQRVIVPRRNAAEARLVPGIEIVPVATLAELAHQYGADVLLPGAPEEADPAAMRNQVVPLDLDLGDVVGQGEARRALEVAAAGGHHLLMVGPPGAGKTMLARRLPGLLPDLTDQHAVEVTSLHSLAGTFNPEDGLLTRPPFQDPHHTATSAAVVGGGSGVPRPGAVSLAHRGVLFLDEAPEFGGKVLQTLRQPLEHGELVIHRAAGTARYPARFQLVLAANPCPCGSVGQRCSCSSLARRRYLGRLSGPLLDRVDLHCEVWQVGRADLAAGAGEASAVVASRVREARAAAAARLAGTGWSLNGDVPGPWLRRRLGGDRRLTAELDRAMERGVLTMRSADRVLRLAWTVADLAGRTAPTRADIAQALALRGAGSLP